MTKYSPLLYGKQPMNDKKNTSVEFYPAALTISGSDSGGGSGIQADLRTFNAYGIFGCSAITSISAQNPLETAGIVNIPASAIALQIDTVLKEIPVKYAKCGTLPDANSISAVADAVNKHHLFLICDPTKKIVQSKDMLDTLKKELLPICKWFTPNIPEAEMILQRKIKDFNAMKSAALELFESTGCNIILKGGYLENTVHASDAVCVKGEVFTLKSPVAELDSASESHGRGCTFSAALTAGFAMGMDWKNSLTDAKAFVLGSLRETAMIGPDIFAMYPPTEDCRHEVKLTANSRKK